MDRAGQFGAIFARLRRTYPVGFAIALHVRFASPTYLFQAYHPQWIALYSKEGLVLQDPTVRWGLSQTGTIRWEDLPIADEGAARVMQMAHDHGLTFGFTVSFGAADSRSVASFARSDRAATAEEIAQAEQDVIALHDVTTDGPHLGPELRDLLRDMSIDLTRN